ncbi:MAG: UDP-N-acetylglucosamine--N-acetylmuramyl-(pentapeptide) pyrophosphoryl-undecaprenol N-acetylglucosamine transferase [Phycisphaerales bacterium]|nr:UDP-N-acetylglucosamine--N-acetylmuramyl-(pentapeptide) pyrophosphoryl-undecaprenol N-acetylglucosamine transferase [Phycisphaerales bacterium]
MSAAPRYPTAGVFRREAPSVTAPVYIFAGGGTGGHLFPGLATAAAVRAIRPNARIVFLTTSRPIDRELLSRTNYEQIPQNVRPWPARLRDIPGFYIAWRSSLKAAREVVRSVRPAAVLGLGGYAAGPAVVAAARLGVRTAILNPDAVPGRANRRLAAYADRVIVQWDESAAHFRQKSKILPLGCPIRAEFAAVADRMADEKAVSEARRRFGLELDRRTVLITGASQGARTINDAILWAWARFTESAAGWQALHLTGTADHERIAAEWGRLGALGRVLAFTHDMPDAMLAADIVVSRAGASTLAELTAVRRPSILMPYPYHADQHQMRNAEVLACRGAARIVEDTRDVEKNGPALLSTLKELANDGVRSSMAAASSAISRSRAAGSVAAWMTGA